MGITINESVNDLEFGSCPIIIAITGESSWSSVLDSNIVCSFTQSNITADSIGVIDGVSCDSTEIFDLFIIDDQSCD